MDEFLDLALELISESGQEYIHNIVSNALGSNKWERTTTSTSETLTAFMGSYKTNEVDGTRILQTDVKCLIAADDSVIINNIDTFVIDAKTYEIINITLMKGVIYIIQLRAI